MKTGICLCALAAGVLYAGAARADTTLKSSVASELAYDSNATIAPQGGNGVSDFLFRIAPQLNLVNERRNTTINAMYRLTSAYYFKHSDLNAVNHNASLNAKMTASPRLGLALNDSFTYTKDSLDTSPSGILLGRTSVTSNAVDASATYQFTERTSASLSASNNITQYNSTTATDSRVDTGGVSAQYAATPSTTLNGSYTFTNYTFDSAVTTTTSSHSVMLGFIEEFPDALELKASAGVSYTPELGDKYNWLANASLRKDYRNGSATIGYSRSITNSSGLTDQLNVNENYTALLAYSATRFTDIALNATYSKNRTIPSSTLDLKSYSVGLTCTVRLYRWLDMEVGANHFRQSSAGTVGGDFIRDQAFIKFTASLNDIKL